MQWEVAGSHARGRVGIALQLSCYEQEIAAPKMIPESVVAAGMKAFEEAYNQGNYEFCGSCYTDECNVVVSAMFVGRCVRSHTGGLREVALSSVPFRHR